jgi:large subunit ribosomal protein L22
MRKKSKSKPEQGKYRAEVRFIRISPSKVRRVAKIVRKKPYPEAIATLETLPHKGARFLKKVIKSAVANALYKNDKLDENTLYIKSLQVLEGPRMKRIWVRARGRADHLLKRLCHITVVIDEIREVGKK